MAKPSKRALQVASQWALPGRSVFESEDDFFRRYGEAEPIRRAQASMRMELIIQLIDGYETWVQYVGRSMCRQRMGPQRWLARPGLTPACAPSLTWAPLVLPFVLSRFPLGWVDAVESDLVKGWEMHGWDLPFGRTSNYPAPGGDPHHG